ncbi:sigma-70 family RNA polymerase sigma factor [Prauserella rugosa]|uniref:sigma-70 family RNA polymerase sigma factor n=1 Tax=Prauserella rugosa TaxID=43354 RepID=UPI00068C1D3B|nr:sigma-70 family RNA polymerase sigma factor [Prauserella rugosa]
MERTAPATDEVELLERLRQGEDEAFGELFELHVASVRRLARGIARDASEAEDVTAETFFRVLQAVRRGNGPRDNVRAYLLTVARRVTWEWHGAKRDVPVSDDELTTRAGAGADAQSSTAEATLITRAFSSLPERWRTVLWQTEVEGVQPANVAPEFGLSPNATAALARRARIGLRAAYLQAHLSTGRSANGCRTIVEKLGGYTAGSVTGAEARKVRAHLSSCASCRATHDELMDVCSTLRSHAGILVLLVPAAGLVATSGGATGGAAAASASSVSSLSSSSVSSVSSASGASVSSVGGMAALGAHVKVGLAVASTVAVGAAGIVAVGHLDGGDTRRAIGLHGSPGPELNIVDEPVHGRDHVPGDGRRPAPPVVEHNGDRGDTGAGRAAADDRPRDARGPLADTEYVVPPSPAERSAERLAGEAAEQPQPRNPAPEQPAGPEGAARSNGSGSNGSGPDGAGSDGAGGSGDAPAPRAGGPAPREGGPVADEGGTSQGPAAEGRACGIPSAAAPECPAAAGSDGTPPGQVRAARTQQPEGNAAGNTDDSAAEPGTDARSRKAAADTHADTNTGTNADTAEAAEDAAGEARMYRADPAPGDAKLFKRDAANDSAGDVEPKVAPRSEPHARSVLPEQRTETQRTETQRTGTQRTETQRTETQRTETQRTETQRTETQPEPKSVPDARSEEPDVPGALREASREPVDDVAESRAELLKLKLHQGRKPAAAHFRGE